MRRMMISLFAALAVLALTCAVSADEYHKSSQSEQMETQRSKSLSAEKLMGMTVVSRQGETLGEIKDFKLDVQSGRISYVILSKGGVLGMGEENVAVPLGAITIRPDTNQAIFTADQNKLENAPKQANMSDENFIRELQSYYGVSPQWEPENAPQMQQPMKQKMPMGDY